MNKKGLVFSLLILSYSIFVSGCTCEERQTSAEETHTEVLLPMIFRVEPSTNISDNQEFVDSFNRQFEGIYRMDIQWLTESTDDYRNKLKQWNVLDEMPVLITDAGFDYDFYDLMVKNNRLVDLRAYMEDDPSWMEAIDKDILTDCMEEDGSIYLSPLGSNIYSYAGVIYNENLLKKAGYEVFPETWEDFFECLENLQKMGITPLALHGSGSYWASMLFATAYMERTEQGRQFLSENFPKSYQNESMEEMLKFLIRLYTYTFEDAVQIDFDEASKRFLNGDAAMIANGHWMFDTMEQQVKQELRFAMFPEGVLMNSPRMSAWAICEGYEEEVIKGVVEALKFRVKSEQENVRNLLNGKEDSILEKSYLESIKNVKITMPNYQMKWEQKIQNEFFTEYMPEMLNGSVKVEEMLCMMDEQVENINQGK